MRTMYEDALSAYRRAGRIAAEVRRQASILVRPGVSVTEICNRLENEIRSLGAQPAFPINVCVNEIAAHDTASVDDNREISNGSLVKVDIGVHVEGYLVDTAVTISLNPELDHLQNVAEEALQKALKSIRPKARAGEIGGVIESTIESYGLIPVRNLSGHQISRFTVHTGKSIPNVRTSLGPKLGLGEVYAIEPFVTTGDAAGEIEGHSRAEIYRIVKERSMEKRDARELLTSISRGYKTLPFARRWLTRYLEKDRLHDILNELISSKCVAPFPVLVERTQKPVAQAEHTVLVEENGCEILTD